MLSVLSSSVLVHFLYGFISFYPGQIESACVRELAAAAH